MVWSPINHMPHRELAVHTTYILLSTANGTTLTLSGSHIVYVSAAASGIRTPMAARELQVRIRWSGSGSGSGSGSACAVRG